MKSINTDYLVNAPYEVQAPFCQEVVKEIETFLSIKYQGAQWDMRSQIFDLLLKSNHDHQSELWSINYTCMNLLATLAHPEIKKVATDATLIEAADLLRRLVEFFSALQNEGKLEAELDIEMLKGWGTDNIQASIHLHHEYAKKTKLAIYEKQLEADTAA